MAGPKKALSQPGGAIRTGGEPELAALLGRALQEGGKQKSDVLTHGFHAYPARMHPAIASTLIETLSKPKSRVLDPFCGSGTVLVEARIRGHHAAGIDLNPLALRIAEVKCAVRDEAGRQRFLEALAGVTARSLERVRGRVNVRAELPRDELQWYSPHVLKELAGLLTEIRQAPQRGERRTLEMVFSAIVVKFSKQRSETDPQSVEKRIRKGLCTEFFERKGRELCERWAELEQAVRGKTPPVQLFQADAREVGKHVKAHSVDLVVTSPPYGGTYDYVEHHARRFAWLGLDASALRRGEIGARRSQQGGDAARSWEQQLRTVLKSIREVIKHDARVAVLIGDAQFGARRISALDAMRRVGRAVGLELEASASQKRVDFAGTRDREEHLIVLRAAR